MMLNCSMRCHVRNRMHLILPGICAPYRAQQAEFLFSTWHCLLRCCTPCSERHPPSWPPPHLHTAPGVDVLLNKESKRETPSVVSFTSKMRLMGTDAGAHTGAGAPVRVPLKRAASAGGARVTR